jgi:hypothetical protein
MILLDRMLLGGIRFVLDKLVQAVDGELNDEGALREELLRAQMRHELGEISAQELERVETDILVRLREILERKGGGAPIQMGGPGEEDLKIASVEATFGGDEEGLQALDPGPRAEEPGPAPPKRRRTSRRR